MNLDLFFHPDTLVTLAEDAVQFGENATAGELLARLQTDWRQLDRDLAVQKRAAQVRRALEMPAAPAWFQPTFEADISPVESDMRPCDAAGSGDRCGTGLVGWCDLQHQHLGCCSAGTVWTVDGACGCPPGGSSTDASCPAGGAGEPKAAITLAVQSKKNELVGCYKRAFDERGPIGGRIRLRLELGPEGQLLPLGPENSALTTSPVQTCLHRVLRSADFPKPIDGHMVISLPLLIETAPEQRTCWVPPKRTTCGHSPDVLTPNPQ